MNKHFIALTVFVILINSAFTQTNVKEEKGVMSFKEETHNFGTFKEEDGLVTHSFTFVNTGNAPILISGVRASCGCTTPDWSKEPVLPGKKGFIKATYNPRNRPGSFMKVVTVSSNASVARKMLRIRGHVLPRKKTAEELYPRKMGALWLNSSNASFSTIRHTKVKTYEAKGYNSSNENLSITFNDLPKYLMVDLPKKNFDPKEKFTITLKYDASLLENHWGFKTVKIPITINGKSAPDYFLTVSATRIEDFTHLTSKELSKAPKLEISDYIFDFKEIKQGEIPEKVITITNTGKSDLIIRNVDVTCDCTITKLGKKIIPPNKQTTLTIKFDSNKRKGKQNKYVNIITNDPYKPQARIRIWGNITL